MIDSADIILSSSDAKQDLFLDAEMNWFARRGNPTNDKVFSFLVQYELAKIFKVNVDKPVMLQSNLGKYLGLKTSRFDDYSDGSFRFEHQFKKKDFINPNHILRITILNYIFELSNTYESFVFNRQNKILIKRGYSNDLIDPNYKRSLKHPLFRMLCKSTTKELFDLELTRALVLMDGSLMEKLKKYNNYYNPEKHITSHLKSSFDAARLEQKRIELLNAFYLIRK